MASKVIECGLKVGCLGTGAIAQWIEFLSRMCKVWVPSLELQALDMVVHTCNLGNWGRGVQAKESEVHVTLSFILCSVLCQSGIRENLSQSKQTTLSGSVFRKLRSFRLSSKLVKEVSQD